MPYPDLEIVHNYPDPEQTKEPSPIVAPPPPPVVPTQAIMPRARDFAMAGDFGNPCFNPVRTKYFAVKYTDRNQSGPIEKVPDYLVERELHDLLGSLTEDGYHAPNIDLDFPCKLVETSSGHFHLFLETKLTWEEYLKLLRVMEEIGLVQKRVLDTAIERGQTMTFVPGRKLQLKAKGILPPGSDSGTTPPDIVGLAAWIPATPPRLPTPPLFSPVQTRSAPPPPNFGRVILPDGV